MSYTTFANPITRMAQQNENLQPVFRQMCMKMNIQRMILEVIKFYVHTFFGNLQGSVTEVRHLHSLTALLAKNLHKDILLPLAVTFT
jgi:hypothetical protein